MDEEDIYVLHYSRRGSSLPADPHTDELLEVPVEEEGSENPQIRALLQQLKDKDTQLMFSRSVVPTEDQVGTSAPKEKSPTLVQEHLQEELEEKIRWNPAPPSTQRGGRMAQRARGRDRGRGGRSQDGWRMRATKASSPPPTPRRPITHVGSGSNTKAESNVMSSSKDAASKWVITEKPIWNIKENFLCDEDNSQKEEVSNFTTFEKLNEFVKTLTSLSESTVDDLNVCVAPKLKEEVGKNHVFYKAH
ncbi:hypothetical protein MA16_Dca027984 [Dendrobium catenatum]|uniref:Uncharacterized protein n=1 Tax=Dendrobium catenatum TaxID=906689 RepID=A0A2I0V7I1_9ASPA|nr:hypothetical protein MA16_Dca027984 [Dendrobium catenatum]